MGKLVVEALKWGVGLLVVGNVAGNAADKAGEGLGDGARNALTIAALGAVAYMLLRKA